MSSQTRTFVALPVPSDIVSALNRLRRRIEPEVSAMRWVETSAYHITLAFLGDVEHADLAQVCQKVRDVSAGFEPLPLDIKGLGAFPRPSSARTLWAGVSGAGLDHLVALQNALSLSLRQAGYPPDEKGAYTPHLTLARARSKRRGDRPPDLSALLDQHQTTRIGSFSAREVVAYSSVLRPEGPEYAALVRARLTGPNSPPPA